MTKLFMALTTTLLMAITPAAFAAGGHPNAECKISPDKSSILVIGSNGGDTSFKCMAACRANVEGQRAFHNVQCNFNLGKGAAEKAVCEEKAPGGASFTKVSPTKMTCVPR